MRVLVVLLAMVAMPLGVSMSQTPQPFGDPKMCGQHLTYVTAAGTHLKQAVEMPAHGGKHGVLDYPCAAPPSEEPPPAPQPPPEWPRIEGQVFELVQLDPVTFVRVGLANWVVELTEVNTHVVTTAQTNETGNYTVAVPAGTYMICQVLQTGWTQVRPNSGVVCPSGFFGHSFAVVDLNIYPLVNFRNSR